MPREEQNRPEIADFESVTSTTIERQTLFRQLQRANALLDVLFAQAPLGIGLWDRDLKYLRVNDALAQINGLPVEAHYGKTVAELLPDVDASVMQALRRVVDEGIPLLNQQATGETPAQPGVKRSWSVSYYPIRLQQEIVGIGAICEETTDKQRHEMERTQLLAREQAARADAERAQKRLYDLFMRAPSLIALLHGPQHIFELVNPLYSQLVGHRDLLGKPIREALPELEGQGFFEQLDHVYATGETIVGNEVRRVLDRGNDGTLEEGFFNFVYQPSQSPSGAIDGILLHAVEVTGQVRARQRSEESVGQLAAIIASIADGLIVFNQDGQIVRENAAASELLGREPSAKTPSGSLAQRAEQFLLRDTQGRVLPASAWPVPRLLHGEVLKGTQVLDVLVRALDGQERALSLSGAPIRDIADQVRGAVLIARDVTERRQWEQRTQEALETLLLMAETLVRFPDTASTADETAFSMQHEAALRLVELTCDLLGCHTASLITIDPESHTLHPVAVVGFTPEVEQQFLSQMSRTHLNDYYDDAAIVRLYAGEATMVDVTQPPTSSVSTFGVSLVLTAPMRMGEHFIGVLAMDYTTLEHKYPLEEEMRLALAISKLCALVIEREQLIRERTTAQAAELAQREATQRMDDFLSMTSHELRTPLAAIKATVQLASRQLARLETPEGEAGERIANTVKSVRTLLERAERQVAIQNRLVSDLLDVSRIQAQKLELHVELCDLAVVVREAVRDQQHTSPTRTISLDVFASEPVLVIADTGRIEQVINNYITNALKFSNAGTPIRVHLQETPPWVRVSVQDEGQGLTRSEQRQIWERFHQTQGARKQAGAGMGLGLYISQTIIGQHQGQVGVESVKGKGSTFWFTLPLADE